MKQAYTICYISRSKNLSQEDIRDIFKETESYNNSHNIKGLLLYSETMERFLQVLEGEKKELVALYNERIVKDDRHTDIMEVFNRETSNPIFDDYSSKFNLVKTHEDLEKIKNYFEKNKLKDSTSEKLYRLVDTFLIEADS